MATTDNVFPKKWEKKLPGDFKDAAEAKSNDELLKEILKSAGIMSDLEKDMDNDAKLQSLKEDLKALSGGYKDELNSEQAKINYCLFLLRQRGAR
jgi:hypothetical protein